MNDKAYRFAHAARHVNVGLAAASAVAALPSVLGEGTAPKKVLPDKTPATALHEAIEKFEKTMEKHFTKGRESALAEARATLAWIRDYVLNKSAAPTA